jgi:4-carboxymuconolactone decarboxylase
MLRMPVLRPDELDDAQRALYEKIAGGLRAGGPFAMTDAQGGLTGPFNAMLYAPAIGDALQALGAAIRYGTALPDRLRELVILAVAAHWDCGFEVYAHEAVGRRVGLTEDELAAVRSGADPGLTDPVERAGLAVAGALMERGDLDDAEYADAVAGLGRPALVELSTLVGYYGTLALQLRIFRVSAPREPGAA